MKHRSIFTNLPKAKTPEKPKRKWVVLPVLWVAFKRMLMVMGALVLFSSLTSLVILSQTVGPQKIELPDQMVLFLEFQDTIHEVPPPANFAAPLIDEKPLLREMIAAIDAAAKDDRVKGIYARMRDGGFALAHIQELRAALNRFKDSGKFTTIYSESYGGTGGGLGRYYLASAFDEIVIQPIGVVSIAGINIEMPFVRRLLDRIGVTPEFFQRKDYKTAYESITNEEISAANAEMMNALADDIISEIKDGIARDREIEPARLATLMDVGLWTADTALEAGLVDRLAYADQLVTEIEDQFGEDKDGQKTPFIDVRTLNFAKAGERQDRRMMLGRQSKPRDTVALVYVSGAIMPGGSQAQSFGPGTAIAAAAEIAPAIIRAAEDDSIKAIVLRVDSPGGSPVASETILRALQIAKDAGKKIIVSMGPVAASGGYWVASNADQIFVSTLTITGSIGVIGGKFSLAGLWDQLGVNWENIKRGENAGMWSMNETFSDSEAERMNRLMDFIYENFIARVAQGRDMSVEQVDAIAGGRVWSGKAALDNGLADQAGGLKEALNYTAQRVTGKEDATTNDIHLVLLPKPKTPLEQLIELLGGQVSLVINGGQKISTLLNKIEIMSQQNVMAYEPLSIR